MEQLIMVIVGELAGRLGRATTLAEAERIAAAILRVRDSAAALHDQLFPPDAPGIDAQDGPPQPKPGA